MVSRRNQQRPGALKHKITIQSATRAADSFGDLVPTWSTINNGVTRGNVVQLSSRQSGSDMAETAGDEYVIEMRYRADITRQMRIVWGALTMDVTGMDTSRSHDGWMHVYCQTRELE